MLSLFYTTSDVSHSTCNTLYRDDGHLAIDNNAAERAKQERRHA